ncbi:MAG: type II toxin-antitoxin system Phd/YefM family antitoxin [Vitreimonas sp.]
MTKRYSIAEARAALPTLVDEVEAGNKIELTRRGKPVAVVVSRQLYERMMGDRPRFTEAYAAFRKRFDLNKVGTESDDFKGLRDRGSGRDVDL